MKRKITQIAIFVSLLLIVSNSSARTQRKNDASNVPAKTWTRSDDTKLADINSLRQALTVLVYSGNKEAGGLISRLQSLRVRLSSLRNPAKVRAYIKWKCNAFGTFHDDMIECTKPQEGGQRIVDYRLVGTRLNAARTEYDYLAKRVKYLSSVKMEKDRQAEEGKRERIRNEAKAKTSKMVDDLAKDFRARGSSTGALKFPRRARSGGVLDFPDASVFLGSGGSKPVKLLRGGALDFPDASAFSAPGGSKKLQFAKRLAASKYKGWTYGGDKTKKQVDCVQFVLETTKGLLGKGKSISDKTRKQILISNLSEADRKNLPKLIKAEDNRIKGVQHALVSSGRGKAIRPQDAKAGDLVQYWMKKADGTWFGHAGVLEKVEKVGGTYRSHIYGAHKSTGGIASSKDPFRLNGPNRKVFIVRVK